jgi:hypothetical protein
VNFGSLLRLLCFVRYAFGNDDLYDLDQKRGAIEAEQRELNENFSEALKLKKGLEHFQRRFNLPMTEDENQDDKDFCYFLVRLCYFLVLIYAGELIPNGCS